LTTHSGLAYGGNKVRKLEYLVADALAKGCNTLVSVGGVQSNHTRAVTATATASGLKAVTVQEKWVPIDPPLYDKTGNILLSRLMGGDVRLNNEPFHIGHKTATKQAMDDITQKGGKPYYVPAGASDHELGGLGFTNFVVELAEQEKQLGVYFDTLIVCSVTGSSHAGLVVGAVAEGKGRKVIGIDASAKCDATRDQVTRIARATAKLLDESLEIPDEAVILDERFHEGIYGMESSFWPRVRKVESNIFCRNPGTQHHRSDEALSTNRRNDHRSCVRRKEYGWHDPVDQGG
jgi:1-aminocyclopropane-1-carboxylate deaminase